MAATEIRTASGALRLDSLSHLALPVRDLDRAELFYTQVLGAAFVDRIEVEERPPIRSYRSRLDVRWGPVDLQLYRQPYGDPTIEQAHPHYAFTTRGRLIDSWIDHFSSWGIPSVLVCRQHGKVGMGDICSVELYFLDPDSNPLELDSDDYIFSERVVWAPYDHFPLAYHSGNWWEAHKHRFTPGKPKS